MTQLLNPRRSGSESRPDARQLPAELLEQAARRVALVAGISMTVATVALALAAFIQPNVGARAGSSRPLGVVIVGLAVSLAMFFAARSERISAARRLTLGLLFLVVISFLTELYRNWLVYLPSDVVRGPSPVVAGLLFFSVVVPVGPRRMALAAAAAAATGPLALWITIRLGNPVPPWNLWLWLFVPSAIGVALATVMARVMFDLGQDVARAQELGAYRLVERLGEGGMGEVWRAEHRMLARPAAIKLVKLEGLGTIEPETMRQRFAREAQATAQLLSPHTIEVYDYGSTDDGRFYYAMELLDGLSLEDLLSEHGPQPPERVAHVLRQACHSLADAHRAGLVHRDIKPANIFLCRRGQELDFVKVLDFGLVQILEPDGDSPQTTALRPSNAAKLTAENVITGTPAYVSPEVATGKPVDGRADLYGLGCVAYALLTGREVFLAKTPMLAVIAHIKDTPEPLGDDVPDELRTVIMRCLEKNPDARPQDAEALAQSLEKLAAKWTRDRAAAFWAARGAVVESTEGEAAPRISKAPSEMTSTGRSTVPGGRVR
ncbi:MAG: serine/threonine protein kinase [Myxococcales bacterium]|nr:serine/threonine protein kinase [Myxococcales bacterium]